MSNINRLSTLATITLSVAIPTLSLAGNVVPYGTYGLEHFSTTTIGSVTYSTATQNFDTRSDGTRIITSTCSYAHTFTAHISNPHQPPVLTSHGSASTGGDVYWYFEFVPSYRGEVPDTSGPYYALVDSRAKGQLVGSAGGPNGASVSASNTAFLSLYSVLCSVSPPTMSGSASDGNPTTWATNVQNSGFTFNWDPIVNKWIGKAICLNYAGTLFASDVTAGGVDSGGSSVSSNAREFKVIHVTSPSGIVNTYNTPW